MSLDKKGDGTGISFGAIFAIVLGLAVIFIIILSVTGAFTGFWDKITGRTGNSNSPEVISACLLACQNENTGDWCSNPRTLKFGEEKEFTINEGTTLVTDVIKTDGSKENKGTTLLGDIQTKGKQVTGSCNFLANNYTIGGVVVEKCPTPLCVSV